MTGFNFADHYKTAGLSPGPEIIKLRDIAFQRVLKAMSAERVMDAVRLYYGLPVADLEWLRSEFAQDDPSFTLVDNQREVSVLAACLLHAGAQGGEAVYSLGVLVGSIGGARKPLVSPELVEQMRFAFESQAITARHREPADVKKIRNPAASKSAEAITAAAGGDPAAIQKALKAMSQEGHDWTKALASQTFTAVGPLIEQVRDLREEVDILWWLLGGWSRILDVPFESLTPATAAVISGLEMGALAQTGWGPVSAPVIIQRMMARSRKGKASKQTLKAIVDGLGNDQLALVKVDKPVGEMLDVFPVLGALLKAKEIGVGAWHGVYDKGVHLKGDFSPDLETLARQAYRESLLLKQL